MTWALKTSGKNHGIKLPVATVSGDVLEIDFADEIDHTQSSGGYGGTLSTFLDGRTGAAAYALVNNSGFSSSYAGFSALKLEGVPIAYSFNADSLGAVTGKTVSIVPKNGATITIGNRYTLNEAVLVSVSAIRIVRAEVVIHHWSAAASNHSAGVPTLTDIVGGIDAPQNSMLTDGSNWEDLGGGLTPVPLAIKSSLQQIESGILSVSQLKNLQQLSAVQNVYAESISITKQIALAPSQSKQAQALSFVDVLQSTLFNVAESVQFFESGQVEASKLLALRSHTSQQVMEASTVDVLSGTALNVLSAEQMIESQHIELSKQIALAQHSSEQVTQSSLVNILSGTQLSAISIEQAVESIVATVEQQRLLTPLNTEQVVTSSQVGIDDGAVFVLNNSQQEVVSTTTDIHQVKQWIANNSEQQVESGVMSALEIKQLVTISSEQRIELSTFIQPTGSMPDIDLDNVIIVSLTPKYIVKSRTPKYIIH